MLLEGQLKMRHLPNIITLIRVILAPVIAILIYTTLPENSLLILSLFVIAAISDWLDGYLARQMQVISSIGRMLDPIADKLLVAGCLIALAADRGADSLFMLPALAILFREILVSGLREYLAADEVVVPVTLLAKWKTAVQMTALGCLIGAPALPIAASIEMIGLVILWVSAAMTVITGWQYFYAARNHL